MQHQIRKPVAIVGAGLAGLTAASFLRRQNVPVVLYEAGQKIAGLATSFHDQDGFTYDFGAHFITNRLAAATGIGAHCRTVKYYGETVLLRGRTYSYPFGLLQVPRFLAGGLASRLHPVDEKRKNSSAAEWFRASYGKDLADEVALPLLEAWSGAAASDLSAAVGNKLQNSIGQTLSLKLASRLTGRAVACGYSHEVPENASVWHVYPDGGLGLLCQKLADELQNDIQLESPVEAILVDSGRVQAIRVKGREQAVSAVISTAPCNILPKLVQGTSALQPLSRFRFRPMVFVNMRFQGRGLLPDTVLWTPEAEFPFFRLTETPLSMPWLAPSDKTLVTVDIGCTVGDEIWQMEEEQLGQYCLEHLKPIIPDADQRYLGCRVLRTPIAYPVFLNEYEAERQKFERSTGIEGLYSIGRNGEFDHILMEDIYWQTLKRVQRIVGALQH
jgi:protoporphyrinogen/coproporphyrinogen III oxidase